ncbi:hypothetical protein H5410_061429 [Solanum commersonii]|uniref:Uncharacterized protein n=1 Tax=Solanum commersonii TaxID=4109 RepID=A0A9J5W8L0_SOLCO|nr:hypothetical protein H5410_061429 [Solanum commersonii]
MSIVCSCISLSGNIRNIPVLQAQIVACLVVPSLSTELCKRAEVDVLPGDNWIEPKNPIFAHKMHGEGTLIKSKKRKVDSGKSVHVEDNFPIPSTANIYVPQSEFDAYLKDQRKQKSQLTNLEKAYTSLAKSHGDLSISHSKIKKREKSRDKVFTQMWKGVKVLWKVLKANETLPTSKNEENGDEPATWSNDGGDEDSEATDIDGED